MALGRTPEGQLQLEEVRRKARQGEQRTREIGAYFRHNIIALSLTLGVVLV